MSKPRTAGDPLRGWLRALRDTWKQNADVARIATSSPSRRQINETRAKTFEFCALELDALLLAEGAEAPPASPFGSKASVEYPPNKAAREDTDPARKMRPSTQFTPPRVPAEPLAGPPEGSAAEHRLRQRLAESTADCLAIDRADIEDVLSDYQASFACHNATHRALLAYERLERLRTGPAEPLDQLLADAVVRSHEYSELGHALADRIRGLRTGPAKCDCGRPLATMCVGCVEEEYEAAKQLTSGPAPSTADPLGDISLKAIKDQLEPAPAAARPADLEAAATAAGHPYTRGSVTFDRAARPRAVLEPPELDMAWQNIDRAFVHLRDDQLCGIYPDGSALRGNHIKHLVAALRAPVRAAGAPAEQET